MLKIKEWKKPNTLEEAYEVLNLSANNKVVGGGLFLRLASDLTIQTAIDLSSVVSDEIIEMEDRFIIGAMTTLRTLEINHALNTAFNQYFKVAVQDIVGIQMRNIATVGGTVHSKYGFSDVLTAFAVMDATLIFYKGGRLPLKTYLEMPRVGKREKRDLLLAVEIPKDGRTCAFQMMRNSSSDFAILNCAVSKTISGNYEVAIGARPQRTAFAFETMKVLNLRGESQAKRPFEACIQEAISHIEADVTFGSNRFGTAAYRKQIAKVLVKRALMEVSL